MTLSDWLPLFCYVYVSWPKTLYTFVIMTILKWNPNLLFFASIEGEIKGDRGTRYTNLEGYKSKNELYNQKTLFLRKVMAKLF